MDHSFDRPLGAHLCQQVHPHHQTTMTHFVQYPSSIHHAKGTEQFPVANCKASSFYNNEKDLEITYNDNGDSDNEDEDDEQPGNLLKEEKELYDGNGRIIQEAAAWHRTKWTNDMVKLLIDIVRFVGEDGSNIDNSLLTVAGNKRKLSSLLQKKGKWRLVSIKMNEGKCYVSPQQCEDKFNDLNKRYKRLNDVLGKDMALEIVDQPNLLESMNNLSSKAKEDVKKILTSKHTFYKEMHSFYNGFDYHMRCLQPVVPCLQPVVLDEQGSRGIDAREALDEQGSRGIDAREAVLVEKNNKECKDNTSVEKHDEKSDKVVPNSLFDESNLAKKIVMSQMLELQRQKVNIQVQALELEKKYFKWQKHCAGRDLGLEKLKEENRLMKAENDRLALLLKVNKVKAKHTFKGPISSTTSD